MILDSKHFVSSKSVRFLLDGRVKTISAPTTGKLLYAIAGDPTSLSSNGVEVPHTNESYIVEEDQEFISHIGVDRSAE